MNFVIPMAGRGQRFIDAGYEVPKMLIEAHGKTLLEWSIDSLPLELCTNMICILLREHEVLHSLSTIIKDKYGHRVNISFHYLDGVTQGQAETVYLAKDLYDMDTDLVIFNIDTYFHSHTLSEALQRTDTDGVLGAFKSVENRFSFAVTDVDGHVLKTAEKEVISNNALTGLYHFKYVQDFLETAEYHFKNNIRVNNEYYIAPMYNYLIGKGKTYTIDQVDNHHILGTPAELVKFTEVAYDTL
ncbi:MAG: glycosyltransferase family 2 protein [Flavipsychrobacter sp.]|nr:glycosyltransferase family 2 protein [Flavipsychrobacter sp.]